MNCPSAGTHSALASVQKPLSASLIGPTPCATARTSSHNIAQHRTGSHNICVRHSYADRLLAKWLGRITLAVLAGGRFFVSVDFQALTRARRRSMNDAYNLEARIRFLVPKKSLGGAMYIADPRTFGQNEAYPRLKIVSIVHRAAPGSCQSLKIDRNKKAPAGQNASVIRPNHFANSRSA